MLALKSELATLLVREEKYWKQRAKAHWLKCRDLNTRFYHQMTSTHKKWNKISGLFDDDGVWTENLGGLENIILSYFTNLFTPSESVSDIEQITFHIWSCISDVDNMMLVEPFDPNEF